MKLINIDAVFRKEFMEAIPFYGAFVSYRRGFCAWYELFIIYVTFTLLLIKPFIFHEQNKNVQTAIISIGLLTLLFSLTFGFLDSKIRPGAKISIKKIIPCCYIAIFVLLFALSFFKYTSECLRYDECLINTALAFLLTLFCVSRTIRELRQIGKCKLNFWDKFILCLASLFIVFLILVASAIIYPSSLYSNDSTKISNTIDYFLQSCESS